MIFIRDKEGVENIYINSEFDLQEYIDILGSPAQLYISTNQPKKCVLPQSAKLQI